MELHTNATQARRYVHKPRNQMELAKEAAACGWGFEDLIVKFKISERDARHLVFGDRS